MRDLVGQLGTVLAERHAAEDALVGEPQLTTVVEGQRHAQVPRRLVASIGDEELTAHAEVAEHGVAVVELHPEVLAASSGADDRTTLKPRDEVSWTGEVSTYGPHVEDLDSGDGATNDVVTDAEADDLDFGKLRHWLRGRG